MSTFRNVHWDKTSILQNVHFPQCEDLQELTGTSQIEHIFLYVYYYVRNQSVSRVKVSLLNKSISSELLRPLLSDACSTVRQCAVVAVSRLAEHDEGVARQLLNGGMVSITLENLNKYNVRYFMRYNLPAGRYTLYLLSRYTAYGVEVNIPISR